MNRGLVVVVLISDWIKLYISTISRYTTRDDNENDDVIGASRSTAVNTLVNNIKAEPAGSFHGNYMICGEI